MQGEPGTKTKLPIFLKFHERSVLMKTKKYEKGQALIIIVVAIIGLIGMTGLTVDLGRTFVDRQGAQSSADNAALAAALAKVKNPSISLTTLAATAKNIAATNGYVDTSSTITVTNPPSTSCNGTASVYAGDSQYINVKIVTNVNTYFAPVVGITQTHNCVEATARAAPATVVPLYNGNAIVGLNPSTTNCGVDTGNSGSKVWTLTGGGAFSNGCIYHPNGTLTIPNGQCLSAVGSINHSGGGTHTCVQPNQAGTVYAYPEDVAAMMPPNPCTGVITAGRYAGGGKVPTAGQTTFTNDVFCITDFDAFAKKDVVLTNATLYVTDTEFSLKFAGGGGFSGTATTTAGSPYKGYYMILPLLSKAEADSCVQNVDYRGNGNNLLVGTILAPSSCWDYRGNAASDTNRSQMIVYNLSSNGTADLSIDYAASDNAATPVAAAIELTK
jgi:hypothetical protein